MNSTALSPAADAIARQLIPYFEGENRLTAYKDIRGIWTIGKGSIWMPTGRRVQPGDTITQAQEDQMFEEDLEDYAGHVLSLVTGTQMTDGLAAALTSFAYNLGVQAFASSTLLRYLNNDDAAGAYNQFPLWDHSGGKPVLALEIRRLTEEQIAQGMAFEDALAFAKATASI